MAAKGRATSGPDDGKRGDFGLAISIARHPKGRAHLVFDDVQKVGTGRPAQWSTNSFFTSVDFKLTDLIKVQLDDQDFVTIGLAVAARLAAQYKARKLSNSTEQYLSARAKRGSRKRFMAAISRVPDREPETDDHLPSPIKPLQRTALARRR